MRTTAANTQRLWRGIPSWQRSALAFLAVLFALVQLGGSSAAPGDPPSINGDWSAPISWPTVAVHMSLEPTGQVFSLDGFAAGTNSERLWDPVSGIFTPIPYGRNLFCSGHIQLADGRTLLVGGHINANEGLADTTLFNPATNTYVRGPDMSVGRWYPTATQLPDGRVLTFAGDNIQVNQPGDPAFKESSVNSLPSIYNPTTNAWTDLGSARLTSPLYPFMFVLSDGRVFDAGPDKITRILNPATATWSVVGTSPIDGMSAVMYRPNKIMKSGSWADPGFRGVDTYPRARSHGGHRHERADAGVARDGGDEACEGVPQPDAASRRHSARERRRLDLRRCRDRELGPAGRDLEPGHGDVDGGRLAPERPPLPLDRAAPARRPRPDGRRRAAAERPDDRQPEERGDLLAAVPLQGPAPASPRTLRRPRPTARPST